MHILLRLIQVFPALKVNDTIRRLTPCDVLLICHDADRGDTKSGLPYSKLIDSVHEDLTLKGYVCKQFALPFSLKTGDKAWAKPYSANRIYFAAIIWYGVLRRIKKIIKRTAFLAEKSAEQFLYHKLLKKAQPKFVIVIGATPALCREGKNKKIPVLELLHAIGYDIIRWNWDKEIAENLPSHILSLDRTSTNAFSPLSIKGVKIVDIPHPWYKRFKPGEEDRNIDPEWVKTPAFIPQNKKIILVSLTCGYDGDHGEYEYYANILKNGLMPEELIQAIELTQEDIFWCLKRHPVQIMDRKYDHQITLLNSLIEKCPNCDWVESTNSALNSLLIAIDGHVSMSSRTAYDAALMGIKSLLFCPTLENGQVNSKWFLDLLEVGYAIKEKPAVDSIINWAKKVKRSAPISISNACERDWDLLLKELTNIHRSANSC